MVEITSQKRGSNTNTYCVLVDGQILLRIIAHTYVSVTIFIGNIMFHSRKILLESIKVLPESSTVNVR